MQNRIPLQEIIAYNNTPKAKALVIKHGYNTPNNYDELIDTITQYIRDYKEEALKELALIHPDRDLLMKFEKPKMERALEANRQYEERNRRNFSNFDMANEYIDFSGVESKKTSTKNKFEEYLPMVVIAGLFALAITSIKKG